MGHTPLELSWIFLCYSRNKGFREEGSRQDEVHRALPCKGSFPETSSLWLKPKQPKPQGIPASASVSPSVEAAVLGHEACLAVACARRQTLPDSQAAIGLEGPLGTQAPPPHPLSLGAKCRLWVGVQVWLVSLAAPGQPRPGTEQLLRR